jgi:hypothetical protein
MRTTLAALSFAAGLGLICQSANAVPVSPAPIQQTAMAASGVEQTQYVEHRGRHHITKCYRELIIGNYVCHSYRNW